MKEHPRHLSAVWSFWSVLPTLDYFFGRFFSSREEDNFFPDEEKRWSSFVLMKIGTMKFAPTNADFW